MKSHNINKKSVVITLIILYLLVVNLALFSKNNTESKTLNYDYYFHATGANQIIKQGYIPFDNDDRSIWSLNTALEYPPGFMLFISIIALVIGFGTLSIPPIMILINWFIFVLFIYLLANTIYRFLGDSKYKLYALLAATLSLTIISGATSQGPIYFVPTTFYNLFMISIFIFLFSEVLSALKKIILISIFLSVIFISHQPSTLIWLLLGFVCFILFLTLNQKKLKSLIYIMIISTAIAANMAFFIYYSHLIATNRLNQVVYYTMNINSQWIKIGLLVFDIIILILFFLYKNKILSHEELDNKTLVESQKETDKTYNYKNIISLFVFPMILLILILPVIAYTLKHTSLSGLLNADFLKLFWNNLSLSRYSIIKKIFYIVHYGLFALLGYFGSLYLYRKNKKYLMFFLIPLLLIVITFISHLFIVYSSNNQLPHRVLLYAYPIFLIMSVPIIRYAKNQNKKILYYIILSTILLSFAISSFATIKYYNYVPLNIEEKSILWSVDNIDKNNIIIAPGMYTKILEAYPGPDSIGFVKYNQVFFDKYLKKLNVEKYILKDNTYGYVSDEDIKKYNKIYENEQIQIYKE